MSTPIPTLLSKGLATATRRVVVLALALGGIDSLVAQTEISITPDTRHQTMVGFGAAISWYNTWIYSGNNAKDAELNQLMFEDSGLDILRLKNWYFPADSNASNPAAAAAQAYHAAKAANPDIEVLLSSWSPPASLKSNDDRNNGGTLKKDGSDNYRYADLAAYWVDLLDNMGWTPDYISFQNEPGWTAGWESCIFSPTEGSNASYGIASDTIWNAIKDRPDAPKMIGSEAENMPNFLSQNAELTDKAYIDVNAYHIYDVNTGSIDSASTLDKYHQVRDLSGDRPNWMTEYSNSGMDWIAAARVIHNTVAEANAAAYIYWKMAWAESDGGDAMINLSSYNGPYTVSPYFYTIKHYAKHVDKGHQRIEIGGSTADVKVSGYLAPDLLSITLVAINNANSTDTIQLTHDQLPISGIAGYQSVADNYYQTMSGLDAANPITLPANSMTTLVLTLSEAFNARPVAVDASLSTQQDTDLRLVLQASDAEAEPLAYTILSGPSHGSLSGSGANRTYSPSGGYTGPDSITFKVNDGNHDSNTATITLSVDPPNLTPTVSAGIDQTVVLAAGTSTSPVAGAHFEWDAGGDSAGDSTWTSEKADHTRDWSFGSAQTAIGITDARFNEIDTAYEFPAAIATTSSFTGVGDIENATFEFVLDTDTNNGVIFESGGSGTGLQFDIHNGELRFIVRPNAAATVLSTPLSTADKARMMHVVGVVDLTNDDLLLYLDGVLVDSELDFAPNDWSGGNGSGLGTVNSLTASENSSSGTELNDFTGKIALFRYYRNQALSPTQVTTNLNALSFGPSATVNLSGSASDSDGPSTLNTTWSVVGASGVSFADANALSTTASFSAAGTYTLRLTADDGLDPNDDDVVITVLAPVPYDSWAGGAPFETDSNGDGMANGMAWALGASGPLEDANLMLPTFDDESNETHFVVAYRRSFAAHTDGNTSITLEYSGDLSTWADAADGGSKVIIESTPNHYGPGIDKVEVRIKRSAITGGKLFCRLRVEKVS